jgi:hemerythrin-like domain-containing protein
VNVLQQLHTDHEHVAQLLDILEGQLNHVHNAESTDFALLRDVMHYMTHYPDRIHHPLENLVIEKLIERDPSIRSAAMLIVQEHRGLAEKSETFLEMVGRVADGEMVLREDIEARGRDYVTFLRTHMEKEDKDIFPLAEKLLTKEDLQQVADAIERRADPVFGAIVETQYEELYAFIQQQST